MRKLTISLIGLMLAASVQATTHRTFVAASGTDVGACGPTAPCRTLTYALTQTNSGGEIVITQSGGYGDATGGLVIDKSVSIISEPGVFAALAPTTGNGITIDTAGINVAIKGLTINGRGGLRGISMTNGTSLDLDDVTITNFPAGNGTGVMIQTPARVAVKNSTLRNSYNGIVVGYGANLLVSMTNMTEITINGIEITGGTSGITVVKAVNTLVQCTHNANGTAFLNWATAGTVGKMYLDRVTVANCNIGIGNFPNTHSTTNVISISNSFVTENGFGLYNDAGNAFLSSGNNHVANNGIDIEGSITTGTIFK